MQRSFIFTLLFVVSSLSVGCSAGLQVVRQDARGGELLVSGPVVAATELAREAILEHCNGRFRVSGIASAAHGADATANRLSGEGRVRYECGDGAQPLVVPTLVRDAQAPVEAKHAVQSIEASNGQHRAPASQSPDA